jgi:hypothetical protein
VDVGQGRGVTDCHAQILQRLRYVGKCIHILS